MQTKQNLVHKHHSIIEIMELNTACARDCHPINSDSITYLLIKLFFLSQDPHWLPDRLGGYLQ